MTVSEKIETISNKIEQNKPQYNLDKQTTKILALSSKNVSDFNERIYFIGKRPLRKSC